MQMQSWQDDRTFLQDGEILQDAENRLRRLSPERLRVVSDFLAYLEEREENEATAELLNISGFETVLHDAVQQAEAGEVVPFKRIRRYV